MNKEIKFDVEEKLILDDYQKGKLIVAEDEEVFKKLAQNTAQNTLKQKSLHIK